MEAQVLRSEPWRPAGAADVVHALGPIRLWATLRFHLRHRLRVVLVADEGPDTTAVYLTGRKLHELATQPLPREEGAGESRGAVGYRWRFLVRGGWQRAYELGSSAAADRMTMRLALPRAADGSPVATGLRPGVRVLAEAVRPCDDGSRSGASGHGHGGKAGGTR